ncbi:unnamed protein product, partial [Rotaria magnacalcarata]
HTTTSSNTAQPDRNPVKNCLVICVDENINEKQEDWQKLLAQVQDVISDIRFFTERDECITFINAMSVERIFLITTGDLGKISIHEIDDMPKKDVFYIFCYDKTRPEVWTKQSSQIRRLFTAIDKNCKSLTDIIHQCNCDPIPMNSVSKEVITAVASGERNLDQLEPSFMYSMLFKEIILELEEDDSKAMADFVAYCRQQQKASESDLEILQSKYLQKSSIWLYTADIFLYKMLNKALGTLDMEGMFKMGFFIRKLHRELDSLYREQSDLFMAPLTVYRGKGVCQEKFENLRQAQGGLFCFNTFLSTSRSISVGKLYVGCSPRESDDIVGILFVITIDPHSVSASTSPFAYIGDTDGFEEEEEILLTMNTVFKVGEIKKIDNADRQWEVHLAMTDDKDPQLAALTRHIKEQIKGTPMLRSEGNNSDRIIKF